MMQSITFHYKIAGTLSVFILLVLLWKIPESLQDESPWTDKVIHVFIFMVIGASYLNAGTNSFKNFKNSRFGKSLLAAVFFSILTEALQLLVPWRHGEFLDLAANILGVCFSGILAKIMFHNLCVD